MQRRTTVVLVLLFAVLLMGAARADELQLGGGYIGVTGTSGGVNFSVNNFTVQFSNPLGDTATGATVGFGSSQPLAFFASTLGNSANGTILSSPQTFTISSLGSGGTLTGTIQSIVLSSTNPGVFGVNIVITPASLTPGATSAVLNQIYSSSGSAVISFQFSNPNFQTVQQITSYSGTVYSTASGAISALPASVPEPASAMLLCAGLAGLAGLRRRRLR